MHTPKKKLAFVRVCVFNVWKKIALLWYATHTEPTPLNLSLEEHGKKWLSPRAAFVTSRAQFTEPAAKEGVYKQWCGGEVLHRYHIQVRTLAVLAERLCY